MINKCKHGVYIPKGETKSPSCSGCNPDEAYLSASLRRRLDVIMPDRIIDASDYGDVALGARLNDAFVLGDMTA